MAETGAPAAEPARTRKTSSFAWENVPAALLRALLEAAYRANADADNLARLPRASDQALAANARRVWGQYPPQDTPGMRVLAPVLLEQWVPGIEQARLQDLALNALRQDQSSVSAASKAGRRQLVAALQARPKNDRFLRLLRRSFLSAHRAQIERPVRTTTQRTADGGPVLIAGLGEPRLHTPYPHQVSARRALDALMNEGPGASGLLVLPTGAGKTETVLEWLLDRMEVDPELRVLWLAHQQELLAQAMSRLERCARARPVGFKRRAREVHSDGSALTVLAEDTLDFVGATVQTLGTRWNTQKERLLARFCTRPLIVVVDEAHHAASATYRRVLDQLALHQVRATIGLTATPAPTSLAARRLLVERFGPLPIFEAQLADLVRDGILASPILHTVVTRQSFRLTAAEGRQAAQMDLSPGVLRRMDNESRNRLVADSYEARASEWGKTLVFAVDIDHADELAGLMDGVAPGRVRVVHSRSGDRTADLQWFRVAEAPAVRVSVGMLTEGVDLPDATTAFLCRPTASRVLLKQMMGRVLRGPRAGGAAEAHVVNFRDEWPNFADTLLPEEALPQLRPAASRTAAPEKPLPDVVDEEGQVIERDLVATIKREFESPLAESDDRADAGGGQAGEESAVDPLLHATRLVGYYDLVDLKVPVFEHQVDPFRAVIDAAMDTPKVRAGSFFDGTVPPRPSPRMLRHLVDHVRSDGAPPSFVDVRAAIDPWRVADRILAAGALTEMERATIIEQEYEMGLARAAFRSLTHFEERVDMALREQRLRLRGRAALTPERIGMPSDRRRRARKALPQVERDLGPIWARVKAEIPLRVGAEVAARLNTDTEVRWTPHVVKGMFAYWTLATHGRRAGSEQIRVNRVLSTRADLISDELLALLLYHEALHGIFVGEGHSADFRSAEAQWPRLEELNLELDTLYERFDLTAGP